MTKYTIKAIKTYEIRDLGTELFETLVSDNIDVDYELDYYELSAAEKLAVLKIAEEQFTKALNIERMEILKNERGAEYEK